MQPVFSSEFGIYANPIYPPEGGDVTVEVG